MLEQLFKSTLATEMRAGPLGPHLEAFGTQLLEAGYLECTIRGHLRLVADFSRWLRKRGIAIETIAEHVVEAFVRDCAPEGRLRRRQATTMRVLLDHLRRRGVVASPPSTVEESPLVVLERGYERHLRVERGLTPITVGGYLSIVHRLLVGRFGDGALSLRELRPSEVSRLLLEQVRTVSPGRGKLIVTALRSFFRFLMQTREIDLDLAASLPAVANWQQAAVPKYLSPDQIEQLLQTCDRKTPLGRRDYAILLLLARLGLRAGEVVRAIASKS